MAVELVLESGAAGVNKAKVIIGKFYGFRTIDPEQLVIEIQESDSHCHMKYPHRQLAHIALPQPHVIPPRIQAKIEDACARHYDLYYPKTR